MSRKLSCLPCARCEQGCADVKVGGQLVCRSCASELTAG